MVSPGITRFSQRVFRRVRIDFDIGMRCIGIGHGRRVSIPAGFRGNCVSAVLCALRLLQVRVVRTTAGGQQPDCESNNQDSRRTHGSSSLQGAV
jgi:hypothetical protein